MISKSIAVIPARANSKRLPQKNKLDFNGKPLISWTIEAALNCKNISNVIVTTDDEDILAMNLKYQTVVFDRRPDGLALDSTPTLDVVIELMNRYQNQYAFDNLVLLQPTSPLRNSEHIEEAFRLYEASEKKQLVSVRKLQDSLNHIILNLPNEKVILTNKIVQLKQFSDLKVLNGAIYISDGKYLREQNTFLGSSLELYEMDEFSSVDIDSEQDWKRADSYFKYNQGKA
jgi:CMP-N,N'-diacetyllegionaminic acid synthase